MPHDRDALRVLVEKVRAATGPDREIDYDIWAGVDPEGVAATARTECLAMPWPKWREFHAKDRFTGDNHRPFTDCLNAALDLAKQVLPRWSLRLSLSEGYQHPCVIMGRSYPTNLRVVVEHHTVPLTVVLAAASALLAQAEAEAGGQP